MFFFFHHANFFLLKLLQELVGKETEKNQHFWRTFILVFWKTIRFASLQKIIWYQQRVFYVPYGKFSLFNFDYFPSSFKFLTKKFNIGVVLYVTPCRTQNCTEIIGSEERMR